MKSLTMRSGAKHGYNAASIQVNSDIEGVRHNPTIYITSNDSYGMWVCLREIIDNARDEARAEGTTVHVNRYKDPYHFTVYDDGRGMPVDMHPKEKKSGIELIFCKLNAGAKMQHGEGTAYKKATSGVHGMGACITNALSKKLLVNTFRHGKWHEFTCANGAPQPVKPAKAFRSQLGKHGTEVNFTLDPKFFEDGSKIETDTITEYLELQSEFYPNLKFTFQDETNKSNNVTYYNKIDLGKQLAQKYDVPEKDVFFYSKDGLHIALTFGNTEKKSFLTDRLYACGMPTPEGGTHWGGFVAAVSSCLPVKQRELAPAAACLFAGVLNVEVDKPKFGSQTKRKLRNPEVAEQVYNALAAPLRTFFGKHKTQFAELVEQAKLIDDMQKRHDKEAKLVKAVGSNGKINLPAKLVRAPDARPEERELYIVEGTSALGTAVKARFPKFQEILPLTGKILNVIKNSEKAADNVAVQRVLRSLGYTTSKNLESLRVKSKIIFLTDADADGGHISLLLLAMMQQYLPLAFKEGLVYVLDTPLYKYQTTNEQVFADTLTELRSKVKNFNPLYVSRMKGWGECTPESLRKIAFADTRKLIRVLPMQESEREEFYGLLEADSTMRRKVLNASAIETAKSAPKIKVPTFKKSLTPQQNKRLSFKNRRKARKSFSRK